MTRAGLSGASVLPGLIDSHAHLGREYFSPAAAAAVLARAAAAGVVAIVFPGTRLDDSAEAAAMAAAGAPGPGQEGAGMVWAAVGVHPHEAASLDQAALERLAGLLASPRVVAVGECGLDYHYDHAPREVQREALRRQVGLARAAGKPLILHNRESDADLVALLEGEGAAEVGGVVHSFAAPPATAERLLRLGFHLGFGGIVTFKSAAQARESLRTTPLDRLLLETDSPYLTPEPFRGRPNEPAHVRLVAARVALELGLEAAEVVRRTSANASRLFGLSGPETEG